MASERDQPGEDIWSAGRAAARAQVRSVFAPRARTCHGCGATESSASRFCPRCGAPYAQPRRRGLSRRTRLTTIAAAVLAAIVTVLVSGVLSPKLHRSDRAAALAAARVLAANRAAAAARVAASQRPHSARGARAPAGLPHAAALRERAGLLAAAEQQITADMRQRVARRQFSGPILSTSCSPYPAADGARVAAEHNPAHTDLVYSCLVKQADVRTAQGTVGGAVGYPFYLRVHYDSGRFTWCKATPPAGEMGVNTDSLNIRLPPACSG